MRDEDIVMTLPGSFLASYEYLITTLELMPMKDIYDELRDGAFDARDVKAQGEGVPM